MKLQKYSAEKFFAGINADKDYLANPSNPRLKKEIRDAWYNLKLTGLFQVVMRPRLRKAAEKYGFRFELEQDSTRFSAGGSRRSLEFRILAAPPEKPAGNEQTDKAAPE